MRYAHAYKKYRHYFWLREITHLESRLNAGNRTPRTACLALQEEKPSVLLKNRIRRATRMTCDIFLDISPKNIFYLLLLKTTFDNQLTITIDRTTRTQLGQQKV